MITLYNAVSKDNFIADEKGNEEFIPNEACGEFMDLCKKYDFIVQSRKAYEAIQKYPKEMVKDFDNISKKVIVITSNLKYKTKPTYKVTHSLKEAFSSDKNFLVSSGPKLNDALLKGNYVDYVILNIIPVKIKKGIKVFMNKPKMKLISEKEIAGGRKWKEYKILK